MPTLTTYSPTLRLRERERGAFACLDVAGNLYWVRIFDGTIQSRSGEGWSNRATRLVTPEGSPVCHVADDLYLLRSRLTREWIEVESLVKGTRLEGRAS